MINIEDLFAIMEKRAEKSVRGKKGENVEMLLEMRVEW